MSNKMVRTIAYPQVLNKRDKAVEQLRQQLGVDVAAMLEDWPSEQKEQIFVISLGQSFEDVPENLQPNYAVVKSTLRQVLPRKLCHPKHWLSWLFWRK